MLLLILAAAYAFCAHAQTKHPEYQLGPGDTIRIQIYQNADLTLETRVTENGTITFPLIGVVKIGGMTISSAELLIAIALKSGGFVKQPQVTIVPVQIRSNQVSVLGQVGHPGRFPLETLNVTVAEMIAIAGGMSSTGADIAIVTGTRDGQPFRREIDISGLFLDNRSQDDLLVTGGDVIYVPRAPMFYVYGEVQRPGSYRVERGMTIRQALVQGGGPTPRGTDRGLQVHRRSVSGMIKILTPELNNLVQADDVLYVRDGLF